VPDDLPVVDAHLDLAYNVLAGRDLKLTPAEIREKEQRQEKQSMVTIGELSKGGVAVAFGSIFVSPREFPESTEIEFDRERASEAKKEVDVYRSWEEDGLVRLIRTKSSLAEHLAAWKEDRKPAVLITMESAEPIESPEELGWWYDAGVRMIGPAWGPTRYCGGFAGQNGQAKGLTPLGRELLAGMKELGIPFDTAHSSVELFWEALGSDLPHVVCTHTSPRELNGVDRMPDAAMMKALSERGGIVGLGLGNMFVDSSWWGDGDRGPVKLESVGRTFELMASAAGWDHVGIGSDLDGGIGVEESPVELDTIADIGKIAEVLPEDARVDVLGGNWIRFLESALPGD
jgi:membrane dipeptidase